MFVVVSDQSVNLCNLCVCLGCLCVCVGMWVCVCLGCLCVHVCVCACVCVCLQTMRASGIPTALRSQVMGPPPQHRINEALLSAATTVDNMSYIPNTVPCVCVCVCGWVCARVCVCVCMCALCLLICVLMMFACI